MSLINDALKRAREAQRNHPPSGATPLPPVESPARGGTSWILAVAAILFLAAAGLVIGLSLFGHKAPPPAVASVPKTPPSPPAKPELAPAPPPVGVVSVPATTNNALPPAAPVESQPKLQGIIFNASRPLAIVNGKTVNVGDRVGDLLVKQILKSSVIVQRPDGSPMTLTIGD